MEEANEFIAELDPKTIKKIIIKTNELHFNKFDSNKISELQKTGFKI